MANAEFLRVQAAKCRRLARATGDEGVAATLNAMADGYEAEAAGQIPLPPVT